MAKVFYQNDKDGLFYDGKHKLAPGQFIEIEEGSESPKINQAFRSGWLSKLNSKPTSGTEATAKKPTAKSNAISIKK